MTLSSGCLAVDGPLDLEQFVDPAHRNRTGDHPRDHLAGYAGIMQADAFSGFNGLYDAKRKPAPITEAACWSHGRRHFFDLATLSKSPIAAEAVRRIDELFEIERSINGKTPAERVAIRQERAKPLVDDLKVWMRHQRDRLAPSHDLAKAINYISAAGLPSLVSSTTAKSAYQTMLRSAQSVVLPWAEETGPSQVRTPEDIALLLPTP